MRFWARGEVRVARRKWVVTREDFEEAVRRYGHDAGIRYLIGRGAAPEDVARLENEMSQERRSDTGVLSDEPPSRRATPAIPRRSKPVDAPPVLVGEAKDDSGRPWAIAGLILGVLAVFLSFIGIIPLAAIGVSAVGLVRGTRQSSRLIALGGLILGGLYTLVYLYSYGHI